MIELSKLRPEWLDPRISDSIDYEWLPRSDALILNVDYPLGLAAYEILMRVSEKVSPLLGVYIMGKAATLNGRIGDVMISNVVHDEHSQNTYMFNNCFTAQDVAPFLTFGSVLDNQKVISALGTFLQNPRYMSVFYQEGYTVIEMERDLTCRRCTRRSAPSVTRRTRSSTCTASRSTWASCIMRRIRHSRRARTWART
ncbi:MAG: hypothetical protein U0703_29515 [Anaerolineae bacterium]